MCLPEPIDEVNLFFKKFQALRRHHTIQDCSPSSFPVTRNSRPVGHLHRFAFASRCEVGFCNRTVWRSQLDSQSFLRNPTWSSFSTPRATCRTPRNLIRVTACAAPHPCPFAVRHSRSRRSPVLVLDPPRADQAYFEIFLVEVSSLDNGCPGTRVTICLVAHAACRLRYARQAANGGSK